jgi:hypothetical protein
MESAHNKIHFVDFPSEGSISKNDFAEKYISVFDDERLALEQIVNKSLASKPRSTIKNMYEERVYEIVLHGEKRTPVETLASSWLYHFIFHIPMENLNLQNVLRVSTFDVITSIALSVVPLFVLTVYNMFSKVSIYIL